MTDLAPAPIDLLCPGCGYDLRGLGATARCPECGRARPRPAEAPRIPWERRRRIGRARAYLQTAWLAVARPERIALDATDRAVDLAAAKSFRRVTVLIAFLPLAAAMLLLYDASLRFGEYLTVPAPVPGGGYIELFELEFAADVTNAWNGPAPLGWAMEFVVVAAALAGAWLYLLAASGAPAYFFYAPQLPPVRRASAVAVSYYASATLMLFPLLFAGLCGAVWLESAATGRAAPWSFLSVAPGPVVVAFSILAEIAVLLLFIAYAVELTAMLRVATGCGPGRLAAAALGLPLCWAALALLLLIGVPLAAAYVGLVVLSFTR